MAAAPSFTVGDIEAAYQLRFHFGGHTQRGYYAETVGSATTSQVNAYLRRRGGR